MNSTNTSPVDVVLEYLTEDYEFIDALGKSVIGRVSHEEIFPNDNGKLA